MADLTPAQELRAAAEKLQKATDDVAVRADMWADMFDEENRCELPEVNRFIQVMSPTAAQTLVAWLEKAAEQYELYPIETAFLASIGVARAINGPAS